MVGIVVKELIKVYQMGELEVIALRGLDAAFPAGKVTWIRGPSGCGKTTLLNLVGGLDRPTAGSIEVDGKNIVRLPDADLVAYRLGRIGFVFQFFNLVPVLTAWENIELPMRFAGLAGREREERTAGLLDSVGLTDKRERKPDQMSGGEQQRVAVAVALANDPPIVLADEPTGELDSENAVGVLDLLKSASRERGKTVLLVSHDPHAAEVADARVDMADGRIVGPT
jgi:putative ABC transport system ATP-binding protein